MSALDKSKAAHQEQVVGACGYAPLGWRTTLQSMRPGDSLRYFTPIPFSEMVNRLQRKVQPPTSASFRDCAFAASVYGRVARQRASNTTDFDNLIKQHHECVPVLPFTKTNPVADCFAKFGGNTWRSELVYTGDNEERYLYALEEKISPLMADLVQTLSGDLKKISPLELSALTLFYINSVHPYVDGNGRASRLAVISLTANLGQPRIGAVLLGLHWWSKKWFVDIAANSRDLGMDYYISNVTKVHFKATETIENKFLLDPL